MADTLSIKHNQEYDRQISFGRDEGQASYFRKSGNQHVHSLRILKPHFPKSRPAPILATRLTYPRMSSAIL